jgi:hypothetical protein
MTTGLHLAVTAERERDASRAGPYGWLSCWAERTTRGKCGGVQGASSDFRLLVIGAGLRVSCICGLG